jgi:hypothetical protein
MKYRLFTVLVLSALLATGGTALGQGGASSTISGVVVDTGGGVVPGADVVVKHSGTGVQNATVSNAEGAFSFPGLGVGTYTVTVSLQGFKTFVVNDVVVTSGAPASIKAVLEVGGLTEQIVVSSTSEILQTQATTISSTINTNQITKLPLTSRSAMDFVTFLPGVTTAGGNRQSQINGLPREAINITLDGVNIQDNTLRTTDGFFAIVSPRLDAIEEVTVTTAAQGADAAQGAVQIKFVTRSGTNQFTGSGYHYYRSDKLNANTWFNNRNEVAKPKLKQNQYGVRIGGPIVLPGLFDGRNKAFFFVNYEEFRQPSDVTRNRTLLNPEAAQGIYRYAGAGGAIQTVNLLNVAAATGQTSTIDPTIASQLSNIRSATSGGSLETIDPNLLRFRYNVPTDSLRRYPTFRIDYNLTSAHRYSFAYNYQRFTDFPDTLNNREAGFPGFPVEAGQSSERLSYSNSLRSTLSASLVNEARVGYSGSPVTFYKELNPGLFADQGGYHLTFGTVGSALTNPSLATPAPQSRNASSLLIEDSLNWLKGNHSFQMGASWTQYDLWAKNSSLVPTLQFGIVTGDPAQTMFTGSNAAQFFPGASATNLTAAQQLYALLTGRVSQIGGDARLDEDTEQYEALGVGTQRARMREAGLFVSDQWRVRPNLTVNAGVRYELQFPFYPLNSSYTTGTMADLCGISGVGGNGRCNLFQAGVMPGKRPEFFQFSEGTDAYEMDWNNVAPSVGVAWSVSAQSGLMGKLLGTDGDTILRAGYSRAFNRQGMNDFSGQYGANPGIVLSTTRSANLGNLNDGSGLPVLFRTPNRLGPGSFPLTPTYPMTDVITQDYNLFDPNITVPYADSYTLGLQRALGRDMAFEIRYVGTRSRERWAVVNYNEINVFDNNFINEFRAAQANLQANVAAGLASQGFKYRGPGTGTVPLPTIYAFFHGTTGSPNDPSAYTSANFTANNFMTQLARFDPDPFMFANNLFTNATLRTNAANAGVPSNYFLANPDLQGGADLTPNDGFSDYNSLQLELRRRLSNGLQFGASYVFGKMYISDPNFQTFRRPTRSLRDAGDPGDLTHVFKTNIVYDLPFGQGRRFGSNVNGAVDRIIGGWTVSLNSRIQSGRLIDLGNVRLVGMNIDDVHDMFKLRFDDAGKKVWMLPQDVIDNSIEAFSVSATSPSGYGTLGAPTGRYFAPANGPDCLEVDNGGDYGECGTGSLVVTGPMFQQHDLAIAKRVNLVGRTNFEFRFEILNVLNNANFVPVGGIGTDIADYEVTGLTGTNTSRVVQLVSRFNW